MMQIQKNGGIISQSWSKMGIMVISEADQDDELAHFPGGRMSGANFVEDNLVMCI